MPWQCPVGRLVTTVYNLQLQPPHILFTRSNRGPSQPTTGRILHAMLNCDQRPDSSANILELPPSIRAIIYSHLLPQDTPFLLDFTSANSSKEYYGRRSHDGIAVRNTDAPVIARLTSVCRTFRKEVSTPAYSLNQFITRISRGPGIQRLCQWSQPALSSLTYLDVQLNVGLKAPSYLYCGMCISATDKPLSKTDDRFNHIMSQWSLLVKSLSLCLPPKQLWLIITCDCDDETTAREILSPLQELPLLKDCTIRLHSRSKAGFRTLAQRYAMQAVGRDCGFLDVPFRMSLLPVEIRLAILGYTDLITPSREVNWSPEKGYYLISAFQAGLDWPPTWPQDPDAVDEPSCKLGKDPRDVPVGTLQHLCSLCQDNSPQTLDKCSSRETALSSNPRKESCTFRLISMALWKCQSSCRVSYPRPA